MASLRGLLAQQSGGDKVALAVFAMTMIAGGGGIAFPLPEMALQISTAVLGLIWLWKLDSLKEIGWPVWLVAALLVLVPAAQLVPLPPEIWRALPNRQPMVSTLDMIGRGQDWHPLSVMPAMTLGSMLSMVSAAILMVMASVLSAKGRTLVFIIMVVVGLISVAYGVGQVVSGPYSSIEIYGPGTFRLRGFQNNPNTEVDVLLFSMVCVAAVMRDLVNYRVVRNSRLRVIGMVFLLDMPFVAGVVLTGSRTGMALLLPVFVAQAVLIRSWLKIGWRNLAIASICLPILAIGVYVALPDTNPVRASINRFELQGDLRPQIWRDSKYVAEIYKPFGAGFGSFVPVFMANERLEVLDEAYVNRAHNDYLELLIEAGYVGYAAGAIIVLLLVILSVKGFYQDNSKGRGQAFCAIMALSIIGLHSFVDYPMRSMAVAGMGAVCAAMVLNPLISVARSGRRKFAHDVS